MTSPIPRKLDAVPSSSTKNIEGTATWRGAMIGESDDKFLSSDSTLVYDFSDATIDVRMSGIRDWNTPQPYPDMVWNGLDV